MSAGTDIAINLLLKIGFYILQALVCFICICFAILSLYLLFHLVVCWFLIGPFPTVIYWFALVAGSIYENYIPVPKDFAPILFEAELQARLPFLNPIQAYIGNFWIGWTILYLSWLYLSKKTRIQVDEYIRWTFNGFSEILSGFRRDVVVFQNGRRIN
jgi:hypothetical protein